MVSNDGLIWSIGNERDWGWFIVEGINGRVKCVDSYKDCI